MKPAILALAASLLYGCGGTSPDAGHAECEKQFRILSKGAVFAVPEVRDDGDAYEHYFAWNFGGQSKPITTIAGSVSGSCVIDKRTGKGFLTLNGKDLGGFTPN